MSSYTRYDLIPLEPERKEVLIDRMEFYRQMHHDSSKDYAKLAVFAVCMSEVQGGFIAWMFSDTPLCVYLALGAATYMAASLYSLNHNKSRFSSKLADEYEKLFFKMTRLKPGRHFPRDHGAYVKSKVQRDFTAKCCGIFPVKTKTTPRTQKARP